MVTVVQCSYITKISQKMNSHIQRKMGTQWILFLKSENLYTNYLLNTRNLFSQDVKLGDLNMEKNVNNM